MAEAVQGLAGVVQTPLVDHGPEEPGEGWLLLVLDDLWHWGRVGEGGVRPDLRPVVDEDPGQLYALVQVGHTHR